MNAAGKGGKPHDEDDKSTDINMEKFKADHEHGVESSHCSSCVVGILFYPCTFLCNCMSPSEESSERQTSEEGMFYCSLCEVEVSSDTLSLFVIVTIILLLHMSKI